MWYFLSFIIIAIAVLMGSTGCFHKTSKIKNDSLSAHKKLLDTLGVFLSRQEIKDKLVALANSTPPADISFGAMCYARVEVTYFAELKDKYICPVCGEKTLYNRNKCGEIVSYIENCRTLADSIGSAGITLDESQYCKYCSPDIKTPTLCIDVMYPNDTNVYRTCPVTSEDLMLIREFLKGDDKHKTDNDGKIPMKNYLSRLEQLLGVAVE